MRYTSSKSWSSKATGKNSTPSFFTVKCLITMLAPGAATTRRSPSRSRLSIVTSPSKTSEERSEILTASGSGNRFLMSRSVMPNDCERTTFAPFWNGMPRYATLLKFAVLICTPAIARTRRFVEYRSDSQVDGDSATPVTLSFAKASAGLFFIALKHMKRSICVKPTLAFGLCTRSLGKSCIMHSRRVGLRNTVLSLSAYFGLTNSGIAPPVSFNVEA
mmetsp:Transcript_10883/g.19216  ORF Transcript_10883/g.19216 Transcript_10883/m.19216 type:complete len:218 (-) Transcript_10883:1343-1996(-)